MSRAELQCEAIVYLRGKHQCARPARKALDGKVFCLQHIDSALRWPQRHMVYVIDADHGVKIGVTSQTLEKRIAGITMGGGFKPTVVRIYRFETPQEARQIERRAHDLLSDCRTHGEWFHCHPLEATAAVEQVIRRVAA